MNFEINRENWESFFEDLTKRRYEWKTKIEILKNELGDQVLTDGLPLNGITVETKGDLSSIDISVGEGIESHQTHNIQNPTRVAFLASAGDHGDVVDIEEEDGTKTLITFVEPMSIISGYFSEVDMVATVT